MKYLVILLALFYGACAYPIFQTAERKDYSNSVTLLSVSRNNKTVIAATGYAINKDTLVTAAHFCISAAELMVFDNADLVAGNKKARIKRISDKDDLCLLYQPNHGLDPLPISNKKYPIRSDVLIVGFPQGIVLGHYKGEITGYDVEPDIPILKDLIVISAPSVGGLSGSPCMVDGNVIGTLVMGSPAYPHLTFCQPTQDLMELIQENDYRCY